MYYLRVKCFLLKGFISDRPVHSIFYYLDKYKRTIPCNVAEKITVVHAALALTKALLSRHCRMKQAHTKQDQQHPFITAKVPIFLDHMRFFIPSYV